jgi:uncharacterized protein YdeI (YjbR/CyaY-like superfamily)
VNAKPRKAPAGKTARRRPKTTAAALATERFATPADWRAWLERHHAASPGIWLQFARKTSGVASVNHAEALETALCFGWIDGQAKGVDATHWLQKFTPRKPNSLWSQINRRKALELIERGLMRPAGLAAIERAKANGRWEAAYHSPRNSAIPPDLQEELGRSPKAAKFFASLDSRNRYAILFRLQTAKTPETRRARLEKFVAMLKRRETLHPAAAPARQKRPGSRA